MTGSAAGTPPATTAVFEQVTEYRVSAAPLDGSDAHHFAITVEWRGNDRWAIKWWGSCLGTDGVWDYEPRPSSREDEWLASHRFDLDTALRLAREAAPGITVNGGTWAQWQERQAARRLLGEEESGG